MFNMLTMQSVHLWPELNIMTVLLMMTMACCNVINNTYTWPRLQACGSLHHHV